MFKKSEREASHSSDSPRHPHVSFSSITDSPSCSFSNNYDVETFYRDKGSESDHVTSYADRQYVPKRFEMNPLTEYSKEIIRVTYIHEIKMSCDQVMSYDFENKDRLNVLQFEKNRTNIAATSGQNLSSSSSFRTFLKSISPSGRRKHETKKESATKSPGRLGDTKIVIRQMEHDDKLVSREKRIAIKKEFSFKSFSK